MRISTREIQNVGIRTILDRQNDLSKIQQKLATGEKYLVPSDDPVASTQLLRLQQTKDTGNQYQANADAALNRLTTEEGVLDGVTNMLQRVRELAIQGANGSQTNETRGFIAAEIRQRIDELIGLANTRDGSGDFLFSGTKGSTQPFVKTATGIAYNGDQSQRSLQVGPGRTIADADAGSDVFQFIRNGNGTFVVEPAGNTVTGLGNEGSAIVDQGIVDGAFTPSLPGGYTIEFIQVLPTDSVTYTVTDSAVPANVIGPLPYTPGDPITFAGARVTVTGEPVNGDTFNVGASRYKDVFAVLEDMASALETPVASASAYAELLSSMNQAISEVDGALSNILVVRSSVGSRLNAVESQKYVNDDQLFQTEKIMSSIKDLDYADAVTKLNIQMAGLEAAQQTYIKIQGLSMFNYLR